MKTGSQARLPIVFQEAYDLTVWYANHVVQFPKGFRFTLGDRIQGCLFGLLETLQDAAYSRARRRPLESAQKAVDRIRIWNRLAQDLGCLSFRQCAYAGERIESIGKQIGGWARASAAESEERDGVGTPRAPGR